MARYFLAALVAMSFMLSACASPQAPAGGPFAWDGLGQDPNKPLRKSRRIKPPAAMPNANAARQKVLDTMQPYSAAWWVVHDAIEDEEQTRVNERIVICRGCVPTVNSEDRTGSVRSNEAQ